VWRAQANEFVPALRPNHVALLHVVPISEQSTEEAPMSRFAPFRHRRRRLGAAALALLAMTLLAAGPAQGAGKNKRVAKEAENATLGKTVLTTIGGRTLYSLSVEKHGRFICTGSCLSIWHPLLVPAGVRPTGPVKLGTIERPEGGTQVTYKGRPLYRFGGDTKAGQANGEGAKDVGTWHAATPPQPKAEPAPQPSPQPESPYPY
jgi:predicted lipoprotein with Yx(FWY)xxD motif